MRWECWDQNFNLGLRSAKKIILKFFSETFQKIVFFRLFHFLRVLNDLFRLKYSLMTKNVYNCFLG